jgi:hypothetical protein
MFKSNRGGSNYIDWGKVERAPKEVITAIKGNLPYIISQMPYSEQMELLGNYHMKTSDFQSMVGDIKAHLAKEAAAGDEVVTGTASFENTLGDVVNELRRLSGVIDIVKSKNPKWFK